MIRMFPALLVVALCGAPVPALADRAHHKDVKTCHQMGFQKGTTAFSNCLLQLETNRAAAHAADAKARAIRDASNAQIKAAKDAADRDAWDARTGQGRYANQPRPEMQGGSMIPAPTGAAPPAFDRYGNANYDDSGTYIGAHGIGQLVDNPDQPALGPGGFPDPSDLVRQDQANIDASICASMRAVDPGAVCD